MIASIGHEPVGLLRHHAASYLETMQLAVVEPTTRMVTRHSASYCGCLSCVSHGGPGGCGRPEASLTHACRPFRA